MIDKIISGGQTGADEAALDSALFLSIEIGGWIPKGGYNEKGKICLLTYNTLKETESSGYLQRTELNVKGSNATLLFSFGKPETGTLRTIEFCQLHNKPYLYVDLLKYKTYKPIVKWLKEVQPEILNIAGSRESKFPGIYKIVRFILIDLLIEINKIKI